MENKDLLLKYHDAMEKLSARNTLEAQSAFESVIDGLRDEPDTPENKQLSLSAERGIVDAFIAREDYSRAYELIQKAIAAHGRLPALLLQSGRIYMLNNRLDDALADLKSGMLSVPADAAETGLLADFYKNITEAFMMRREYAEALACCQDALSKDPGSQEFRLFRAKILSAQNKKRDAIEELLRVSSLTERAGNPGLQIEALLLLMELYTELKDRGKAWDTCNALASLEIPAGSNTWRKLWRLIEIYPANGEWDKAWEICARLLRKDEGNAVWQIWAGRICAGKKLYARARDYLEKGLALLGDANDEGSRRLKITADRPCAETYTRLGDPGKAAAHLLSLRADPFVKLEELAGDFERSAELSIEQRDHAGAIEFYRNMLVLASRPGSGAEALGADELYAKLSADICSPAGGSAARLDPDLKKIRFKNAPGFVNETYNKVEMLRNTGEIKTKPMNLIVSLTGKCNLDCVMCGDKSFGKWDIPGQAVEEIKSLFPFLRSVQWRGGEAFLSPYFENLVETAARFPHIEQFVNTNGLLIDDVWARRLVKGNVSVIFSIDGIRPETYETIRRGGSYDKLLESLSLLKKVRKEIPSRSLVCVNFVAMKANYHELPLLVKFAKEHGIDEVTVNKLVPFGASGFEEQNIVPGTAAYEEVARSIREMEVDALANKIVFHDRFSEAAGREAVPGDAGQKVSPQAASRPAMPQGNINKDICVAPWKYLFINTGGDVYTHCFCNVKLGNLSGGSLLGLWNGPVIRSLRQDGPKCVANNSYRCRKLIIGGKQPAYCATGT